MTDGDVDGLSNDSAIGPVVGAGLGGFARNGVDVVNAGAGGAVVGGAGADADADADAADADVGTEVGAVAADLAGDMGSGGATGPLTCSAASTLSMGCGFGREKKKRNADARNRVTI